GLADRHSVRGAESERVRISRTLREAAADQQETASESGSVGGVCASRVSGASWGIRLAARLAATASPGSACGQAARTATDAATGSSRTREESVPGSHDR